MQKILIYGGTFDPPHTAHMNVLEEVQKKFKFDKIILIPCNIPALKNVTFASSQQRIAMLELLRKKKPFFSVDDREINRKGPSYMVDTLTSLREEFGENDSISLLLGLDAFLQFNKWHRWQEILTLANLLIMTRAGYSEHELSPALATLIDDQTTTDHFTKTCGQVIKFSVKNYFTSSTTIRNKLKKNENCAEYLDSDVLAYISQENIYYNHPKNKER